ncbi:bifunctional DNA-formamidopyrimidine glycosylase/DNA-(apurinic or apyrimidinic site) lyase [Salmonella enterica subsp. enterica]|nr:bifunctional DNA-formamidopyrimidine glycosylase/DNA-(apurinic or apyrimidinic site) lyase [Salmonella enterica subsp. enterica serovar Enteritidis]
MPELPEVETVRRGLQPAMEGARIDALELRRADLRFPFPADLAARLTGATIVGLGRRAKYLLIETTGNPVLICHLGMTGSFRVESMEAAQVPGAFHYPRSKAENHDHAVFSLTGAGGQPWRVTYNDPRRFGFMLFAGDDGRHPMLDHLGLEPTGNALDGAALAAMLRGKQTPLKAALLDQTLIAGLGNIYVSEALWRARLSPRRAAGSIVKRNGQPTERANALAEAVRNVIADALRAGGSTLRDYMHTDGTLGYFQHQFSVYDREGQPCKREGCGGTIARIVQSGRSTFYCPACQR